jgi:hypothetical protein
MEHICAKPNGDGQLLVPEGWTDFMGACPDTCYVNCNYNVNGKSVDFKDSSYKYGSNYGTSVIGNASLKFVQNSFAEGRPFFALVASHAPHGPATPAEWYKDLYSHEIAPRTPAYNVSSPDKHWLVAVQDPISEQYQTDKIDGFYKNRLRSLRSVDDIVSALYAEVETAGQLNNTFFIFTSDHGLHMGQFCLGPCKRNPYDTDLRIPMIFVGPGIASGTMVPAVTGIPDIAPTVLDLAKAPAMPAGMEMDGRSMVPLLIGNASAAASESASVSALAWREEHLVEYFATTLKSSDQDQELELELELELASEASDFHPKDNRNNTFIGLRIISEVTGANMAYFEFTDVLNDWDFAASDMFCEFYDFNTDPHQLHNMCPSMNATLKTQLHTRLHKLWRCKGASCA